MRFKNRYFLCELRFADGQIDQSINSGLIFRTLQSYLDTMFGDFGAGLLQGFSVKYFNPVTGLGIVRATRDFHKLMQSVIEKVQVIKNRQCSFRIVHIGGSIRCCQRAALRHNARLVMLADRERWTKQSQEKLTAITENAQRSLDLAQYRYRRSSPAASPTTSTTKPVAVYVAHGGGSDAVLLSAGSAETLIQTAKEVADAL